MNLFAFVRNDSASCSFASSSALRSHRAPRLPRALRALGLLGIGAVSSIFAAGCGSSTDPVPGDDDVAVGPDRVPDARAHAELRNDCFAISGKGLPLNVADSSGDSPISHFGRRASGEGWSPIVGSTHSSHDEASIVSESWGGTGWRDRHPLCPKLMSIFSLPGEGTGQDAIVYATRLDHEVVDFAFPTDLASAPPVDTAIPVKIKSTLRIEYQRPFVRPDGTLVPGGYTSREGDEQAWPLEVTCETPFTVEPFWDELTSMPTHGAQFCKEGANGTTKCLRFSFKYTGDKCSFVSRDAAIKLTSGETVRATFGGYFDRRPSKGYTFKVTNVEIR